MIKIPYSLFPLADNFQAVFWPVRGVETVLVSLWVRSGGWYETKVKRGVFHFLEHVLAQGTKKHSSYLELAKKLEEFGISPKNSVGGYFSRYNWIIPKETFSESLTLLAEYIFNPLLPEEAIERERKIILQEYFDHWDKPHSRFHHLLGESFFGKGHPYTFDALGTKDSIENISKDDLIKVHEEYYQLNNIFMGIVGDLEAEKVESEINRNFKNRKKSDEIILTGDSPRDSAKKIVFAEEKVNQISYSLNLPTVGYNKETLGQEYSLAALSYLLGRSRVSRLNLRLREKEPLSYSIGSSVKDYPQKGVFTVSFMSSPENCQRVIEIIKEEIETIKKEGISEEDFKACQKSLIYGVSLSFDTIYSIADNLMDNLGWKGKIFLPEEKKEAILNIAKDDILTAAGEVFDFNKATIGFMGNRDNLEKVKNTGIDKII